MNLFTLNTNFAVHSIIDSYKSFIWTDRYDECGDFELYLPMTSDIEEAIPIGYYLQNSDSNRTMIVEQHKITTDPEDGDWLIVTGRSLESILDRRVVWGQVSYTSSLLQSVIFDLLNDNIISPTDTDRQITSFITESNSDTRLSEMILSAQYAGDNLYDVIQALCAAFSVGFSVTLNSSNQLVFKLYVGVDRTYDQSTNPYVIFSPEFDNLLNSEYFRSLQTYKNTILVGGEGEGSAKVYAAVGSGDTGLDRRETYVDAHDISSNTDSGTLTQEEYLNQLAQKGTEELENYPAITAFDGEMDATRLFVYGRDYFCGDIVQVEDAYGHTSTSRITEMIFSDDEEGYKVYPTFESTTEE